MSTNLQGKVIAITGANGGMGIETAKMLAARGAAVALSDMQDNHMQKVAADIVAAGGKATVTVVDVTQRASVDAWIAQTAADLGKLDGAVNLAGILGRRYGSEQDTVADLDEDEWLRVLSINLTGTMHSMRAELGHMRDGGSIVNAASVAGLMGLPRSTAYGVSKFGIIGLTKCAAVDVGHRRIRVNCLAPGIINTAMQDQVKASRGNDIAGVPVPKIARDGRADEVASLCAWLLCDESSYITGQVQGLCGGFIV